MPSVTVDDVARMRGQLFFEGDERGRKLSRFWLLLVLSAVIASAGVVGDSTATVIGAMIVAPLMTPILGIALAATLADRLNLLRSIALVVSGAVAVVGTGVLVGLATRIPVTADLNSQVAGRIQPRLIDLVAALATGAVGAIALSRDDISDTLPGVAIAISLVPPLAVVGLTLESGQRSEAMGALLLFVANVSAILATGTIVMAVYRLQQHAARLDGEEHHPLRVPLVIATMIVLVAIPLAGTSARVTQATLEQAALQRAATRYADSRGWSVVAVRTDGGATRVRLSGPAPEPDPAELARYLAEEGLDGKQVELELVPGTFVAVTGGG